MADYKLWNALKDAKKYRWVELSHSLNNESPYWSGIPEGSVELAKTVWDWGKPELELLLSIIVDTKNSKNAPNHATVL